MNIWNTKSNYEILQVLSGRCNVFLLTNGDTNILIDTSIAQNQGKLFRKLENLGIESIDYLILTHTHFDHAASAGVIKEKFNSRVIVHASESSFLKTGKAVLPKGTNVFTRNLIQRIGNKVVHKFDFAPCEYDIAIDSCYPLDDLGYSNVYLLPTPGHSPGSISIIVDNEVAIVGDALFGVFPNSIFPPFADDEKELIRSWGKLLMTECSVFLPSHGSERSRNLLDRVYRKRTTSTK
ncbi:MAG: MBL fold metallo-hydrolase [Dysgonomonas sp.]|nr:MBL fold metallo-hydrolase [Dysgonomonas sp.]